MLAPYTACPLNFRHILMRLKNGAFDRVSGSLMNAIWEPLMYTISIILSRPSELVLIQFYCSSNSSNNAILIKRCIIFYY